MFLDAFIIVAILGREPEYQELAKRLAGLYGSFYVSPLVMFEAALALAGQKVIPNAITARPSPDMVRQARAAVAAFVEDIGAEEIPISPESNRRVRL